MAPDGSGSLRWLRIAQDDSRYGVNSLQVPQHGRLPYLARTMTGEQLVDGERSTTLDTIENERSQARYPDDVPPVVAVDDD